MIRNKFWEIITATKTYVRIGMSALIFSKPCLWNEWNKFMEGVSKAGANPSLTATYTSTGLKIIYNASI